MTQYKVLNSTFKGSPIQSVSNAISILHILSTIPKISLANLVKTERSTPIPVFVEKIGILEKHGLIRRIDETSKKTEWEITSLGIKVLKKYEEIKKLLTIKK